MAERVVVVLEAVEVQQDQQRRVSAADRLGLAMQVGQQHASIAQTGQRIGRGKRLQLALRGDQLALAEQLPGGHQ